MNLEKLYEELANLKSEAKELASKDNVTIEEINAKKQEIETVQAKIELQEQIEAEEKEELINKVKTGKAKKIEGEEERNMHKDIRETKAYTEGFYNIIRGKNLTGEQAEIFNTIGTGQVPVPTSFQNRLVEALEELNIMRKLGTVITTETDKEIPFVQTKGVADWTEENGDFHESEDTFGTITLSAYKLTRILKVSEEILEDNTIDLEGYLVRSFARALAYPEESAFINGDGDKKPEGVFVGAEVGVTTASATAITADEIIDLYYSLGRVYRNNAVFIMNDTTLKAIRKLKDSDGNYLWTKGFNGEPETILGRPVYTSQFAPEIGAGNRIIAFGDMSYYTIADRSKRTFQRLNELYSANGQVGFRGYERVDGKLILPETVKVMVMKSE